MAVVSVMLTLYDGLESIPSSLFFKILLTNLFLERGDGRENERERNIDVRRKINQLPLLRALTGGQTCMCPERNQTRPFTLWGDAQPTESQ